MDQRMPGRNARDGGRIACPRCQANNFVGQTQCWQCHMPLPAPTFAAPLPVALPFAQHRQPRVWIVLPVVAIITFALVWMFAGMRRQTVESVPPPAPQPGYSSTSVRPDFAPASPSQTPQEDTTGVRSGSDSTSSSATIAPATPSDTDPLTAQAQHEIERARHDVGVPPPAAVDSSGRVRLRGGGSVSVDDWDTARRKLQASPLLNNPPSPAPF
jgi:hypothetical protein